MGREPDLAQIVAQPAGNAIRYTPSGGRWCCRWPGRRRRGGERARTPAIGIPAADLDRVFERFYRVDAARDRETGGTGLGLAIVRHVAESHGGAVAVRSQLGRGSTFSARSPCCPTCWTAPTPRRWPHAGARAERHPSSRRGGRGRTPLVLAQPDAADRAFRALCLAAGMITLIVLFLIGLFLLLRSQEAFQAAGWRFFTTVDLPANPTADTQFGIAAVMYWTVVIALIALVLAVPVSIAMALFINEYAPGRAKRPLTSLVDLLAAVPSLIYGLWGLFFLQPHLLGVSEWLTPPLVHPDLPDHASALQGVVVHRRRRRRADDHADHHRRSCARCSRRRRRARRKPRWRWAPRGGG